MTGIEAFSKTPTILDVYPMSPDKVTCCKCASINVEMIGQAITSIQGESVRLDCYHCRDCNITFEVYILE